MPVKMFWWWEAGIPQIEERAQTAGAAARTGTATGVEDSDASGTRASAQGRADCTADGDAKAAQATWAGTPTEAGEG